MISFKCKLPLQKAVTKIIAWVFLSKLVSNFSSCIVLLEIWGFKKCPKLLGHPVYVLSLTAQLNIKYGSPVNVRYNITNKSFVMKN